MRWGNLWLVASVGLGGGLWQTALPSDAMAQAAALSGSVSSTQEPVISWPPSLS